MDQVWLCGSCRSLNQVRNSRCYKCGASRERSEQVPERLAVSGLGSARLARNPSLFGALVFGTVAAIVAVMAWYYLEAGIMRGQGRLAWLLGILVGIAIVLGGRGRASFITVLLSVVITGAAIAAGEYLIASRSLADQSNVTIDAIAVAPPDAVWEEMKAILADDPLRPILWVIAFAAAVGIPGRLLFGEDPKPD